MHLSYSISLTLLFLAPSLVTAKRQYHKDEICAISCQKSLSSITFTGAKSTCLNVLYSQSLYICAKVYCSEHDVTAGLANINATCIAKNMPALPYSIISNFTSTQIAAVKRVEVGQVKSANITVIPAFDYFEIAKRAVNAKWSAVVHSEYYGYAMYGFWAFVVSFGVFNQVINLVASRRVCKSVADAETVTSSQRAGELTSFGHVRHLTRQYLTVPATFGHRHAQPIGWCTIPNRIQSLTIALFVILNIVFCVVDYPVFNDNIIYPTKRLQIAQYIGDRTGLMCIANMPLVWLFASRNNILLWVTGWSFATFNRFHRWVARVAVAQIVAHAVAYTYQLIYQKGHASYVAQFKQQYFYTGIVAICLMCLLLPLSAYGLRSRYYEVFLYTHIATAVGILVGTFYHINMKQGMQYNGYVWACVAIWAFDRLLRIARVMFLNKLGRRTMALATYDLEGHVVRLEVQPTINIRPQPGTYYYIYVLSGLRFYESHPFTLSSWQVGSQQMASLPDIPATPTSETSSSSSLAQDEKKGATSRVTPSFESPSTTSTHLTTSNKPTLSFLIRPVAGFTRRLRTLALRGSAKNTTQTSSTVSILIEGPYGTAAPVNTFDHVLYIIGGTGITVALAYLRESANLRQKPNYHRLRQEKLVWVARQRALVADVAARELSELASKSLKVQAYITDECIAAAAVGGEGKNPLGGVEGVGMHAHRPDVAALVLREAEEMRGAKLAVVVCGPGGMADDVRSGVVEALRRGYAGVELFEESFTW